MLQLRAERNLLKRIQLARIRLLPQIEQTKVRRMATAPGGQLGAALQWGIAWVQRALGKTLRLVPPVKTIGPTVDRLTMEDPAKIIDQTTTNDTTMAIILEAVTRGEEEHGMAIIPEAVTLGEEEHAMAIMREAVTQGDEEDEDVHTTIVISRGIDVTEEIVMMAGAIDIAPVLTRMISIIVKAEVMTTTTTTIESPNVRELMTTMTVDRMTADRMTAGRMIAIPMETAAVAGDIIVVVVVADVAFTDKEGALTAATEEAVEDGSTAVTEEEVDSEVVGGDATRVLRTQNNTKHNSSEPKLIQNKIERQQDKYK
mmetsp:Transcript_25613/g.58800  ORF Transcript_25613/g.58800 Transcript_25613/m.58800 type:complete len:314 (+) Transcript_25613:1081-2022(+)